MSLSDLRKLKKEWLNNTVTSSFLKNKFKLSEGEIAQVQSEVRYGQERYHISDVKIYIDTKIKKQPSIISSSGVARKMCKRCNQQLSKKHFPTSKRKICIKCEKKIELQTIRELEKISKSRRIKPKGNQMTI